MLINVYSIIFIVYQISNVVSNLLKSNATYRLFTMDIKANVLNERHPKIIENNKNRIYNPVIRNQTAFTELLKLNNSRRQKRDSNYDLCSRSLCPWTEAWDRDTKRNPSYIAKAVCSSKRCRFNFTDFVPSQILDVLTTCEPLTRDIRVFKNNTETYLKDWPVACLCVRNLISKVPAISSKGKTGHRKAKLKKNRKRRKNQRRLTGKSLRRLKKLKKARNVKKRRCRRFYTKKHILFRKCFSAGKRKRLKKA